MDREINKETRVIDRSTMKRSEYITWHLFYIIVALVLANRLLFVTLPRLSAIQSRLILVFAIILISLVFSIPRWKRNRTQIAVIEDVIIGLGMYIITAYWRFYKNWFTIIIIILSFTTFIVSVCVWLPKYKGQHIFNIENRCTKKRVFKSRFLRMSNLTSLIITVCMLILSGPIIYNKLFYGGIKASTINNDYVVDRGDNSRHLDEYKDELEILIYEDLWKDASVNERLNVAQILADCEVNKLGMSKIKVIISEMPTDDYLSGYDEASKTMYINKEFLLSSSSSDLYTIILHEAYHYDVIPGMRSAERDFEFILMSIARSGSGRFSDIVNIDKKLIMGVLGKMRTSGLNDIPPCSVGKFGMAQALAITSEGIGVSTAVETVINPYQEKNIVVTGLLEGSCLESVSVACCFVNNYIQKELPKLHISQKVRDFSSSMHVSLCN